MKNNESRLIELKTALEKAEQKLADREALLTAAIGQTEAARSQYEQAQERLDASRRRLDTKDEEIKSLQHDLHLRDERIAVLEQLCAETDNTLNAINQDLKLQNLASPTERLAALGLALESLDDPGVLHPIGRATTTIGRATDNDISINSVSVSRYHARIVVASDSTYLIDLQSTNGSTVNEQRINRRNLNDGDVIAIGSAKFKFAVGVRVPEIEDRSFDETHALLDDSIIFSPAPKSRSDSKRVAAVQDKSKSK